MDRNGGLRGCENRRAPAKKPSFWVNRADFVRQYQRIDGFWFPFRDETFVEVKMYGRRYSRSDHHST